MEDVSDDEEDQYDPTVEAANAAAAEPGIQAESWDDFWTAACKAGLGLDTNTFHSRCCCAAKTPVDDSPVPCSP